jgi:hypothetical protein
VRVRQSFTGAACGKLLFVRRPLLPVFAFVSLMLCAAVWVLWVQRIPGSHNQNIRDYSKVAHWLIFNEGQSLDRKTIEREVARLTNGRQSVVKYSAAPPTSDHAARREVLVLRPKGQATGAEVFFSDGTLLWFDDWREGMSYQNSYSAECGTTTTSRRQPTRV